MGMTLRYDAMSDGTAFCRSAMVNKPKARRHNDWAWKPYGFAATGGKRKPSPYRRDKREPLDLL